MIKIKPAITRWAAKVATAVEPVHVPQQPARTRHLHRRLRNSRHRPVAAIALAPAAAPRNQTAGRRTTPTVVSAAATNSAEIARPETARSPIATRTNRHSRSGRLTPAPVVVSLVVYQDGKFATRDGAVVGVSAAVGVGAAVGAGVGGPPAAQPAKTIARPRRPSCRAARTRFTGSPP